jgi:DNA-binding CsgD family transcriptional regulator
MTTARQIARRAQLTAKKASKANMGSLVTFQAPKRKARHSNLNANEKLSIAVMRVNGMTPKEIAYKFGLAESTVANHLSKFRKAAAKAAKRAAEIDKQFKA